MNEHLDELPVRIYNQADMVVGSGVLVDRGHVLTCAHVVARALGIKQEQPAKPGDWIHLDIPFNRRIRREDYLEEGETRADDFRAEVEAWYPVISRPKAGCPSDLALLKLRNPIQEAFEPSPDWSPAALPGYDRRRFHARGFPMQEGTSEKGQCEGTTASRWVILKPEKEIGPGYSGGPVFDDHTHELLGILVAYEEGVGITYMIPACEVTPLLPATFSGDRAWEDLFSTTLDRTPQSSS